MSHRKNAEDVNAEIGCAVGSVCVFAVKPSLVVSGAEIHRQNAKAEIGSAERSISSLRVNRAEIFRENAKGCVACFARNFAVRPTVLA